MYTTTVFFWSLIGAISIFQLAKAVFFYRKGNSTKVAHSLVPILVVASIGFSACPLMSVSRPPQPSQKPTLWYALETFGQPPPTLVAFTEFEGKGGNNMGNYTFVRTSIFAPLPHQGYTYAILEGYQNNHLAFNALAVLGISNSFARTHLAIFEGEIYQQASKTKLLYNFNKIKKDYALNIALANYQNTTFVQKKSLAAGKIGKETLLNLVQVYSFHKEKTFDLLLYQNQQKDKHMLILRIDSSSNDTIYLTKKNGEEIASFLKYPVRPSERIAAITTEIAQNIMKGDYVLEFRTHKASETVRIPLAEQ